MIPFVLPSLIPAWLHPTHEREEGKEIRSVDLALFFSRKPTPEMLAKADKRRYHGAPCIPIERRA